MTNRVYLSAQNRREYAIELLSSRRAEFFALPVLSPFRPFAHTPFHLSFRYNLRFQANA
jgi:hypothetical protein